MIPFIVAGVAIAAAAGAAAYKRYSGQRVSAPATSAAPPVPPPVSLGRFAIWGRPNAGKSTFISRLLERQYTEVKQATTFKTVYKDISLVRDQYQIEEIADMPGTSDRLPDWLELVASHEHIFYLVNFSKTDSEYLANVRADLKATVETLKNSTTAKKRLHIIATHVDKSVLKDVDPAEVNNVLMADVSFRRLHETAGGVPGYVYAANLTDKVSFDRLLGSIVGDASA